MSVDAKVPFHFFSRLTLTFLTGRSAATLGEFLEGLRIVPDSVIYQHTHRYLFEHQFLTPEPPNDFAHWVAFMVGNEALGERLAAVDTVRFGSLADLRGAFISVIEKFSSRSDLDREVPEGKEFHFMGALRFSVPTPHRRATWSNSGTRCGKSPSRVSTCTYSKLACGRPGEKRFLLWFEQELHLKRLAARVAALDLIPRRWRGCGEDHRLD